MMAPGQAAQLQNRLWPTILAGYGVQEPLRGLGGNFQALTRSLLTNDIDFIHMAVPGGHDWHAYALMLTLTMKYHLYEWPDPIPNAAIPLSVTVAQAGRLAEENYTAASWRQVQTMVSRAEAAIANPNSTPAQFNAAEANLRRAMQMLAPIRQ
jgi:hypothetical protein